MEWIDQLLAPFEWVRSVLPPSESPWEEAIAAVFVYAGLMLVGALVVYALLRGAERLVQSGAKALAVGATTQDLIRLEAGSARIARPLRRIAARIIRTGYAEDPRDARLPRPGSESTAWQAVRLMLRGLWRSGTLVVRCAFGLVRFFLSGVGVVVLLAAVVTAFPDVVRTAAVAVGGFLAGITWSEASAVTVATIAAAALPIAVIVLRLLVNDTASATRSFRRQRDEDALMALYRARSAILALSYAAAELISDMVRRYSIEQRYAAEWYAWANRQAPPKHSVVRRWDTDDHAECHLECLEEIGALRPKDEQDADVQAAIVAVEKAWADELGESRQALGPLMSRRALAGLISLRMCMSPQGKFYSHKLPTPQEWRHRRIGWQHGQLHYGSPDEVAVAAGRNVEVSARHDPEEQWLERDLHDVAWDLAELSRELRDLAEFAYSLTRRRRLEKLTSASSG